MKHNTDSTDDPDDQLGDNQAHTDESTAEDTDADSSPDTDQSEPDGASPIDRDFSGINLHKSGEQDSKTTTNKEPDQLTDGLGDNHDTTATPTESTPTDTELTPQSESTTDIDTDFAGINLDPQGPTTTTEGDTRSNTGEVYGPHPSTANAHLDDATTTDTSSSITETSRNGESSFSIDDGDSDEEANSADSIAELLPNETPSPTADTKDDETNQDTSTSITEASTDGASSFSMDDGPTDTEQNSSPSITEASTDGASSFSMDDGPTDTEQNSSPSITEASTNGESSFSTAQTDANPTTSTNTTTPVSGQVADPPHTQSPTYTTESTATSADTDSTMGGFTNNIDIDPPPVRQHPGQGLMNTSVGSSLRAAGHHAHTQLTTAGQSLVHLSETLLNWTAILVSMGYISTLFGAVMAPEQWPSTTGTGWAATQSTIIDASFTLLPVVLATAGTAALIRHISNSSKYADSTEPLRDV